MDGKTKMRNVNRDIRRRLLIDRKKREETDSLVAEVLMETGNSKAAWAGIKSWYRDAKSIGGDPTREDMSQRTH